MTREEYKKLEAIFEVVRKKEKQEEQLRNVMKLFEGQKKNTTNRMMTNTEKKELGNCYDPEEMDETFLDIVDGYLEKNLQAKELKDPKRVEITNCDQLARAANISKDKVHRWFNNSNLNIPAEDMISMEFVLEMAEEDINKLKKYMRWSQNSEIEKLSQVLGVLNGAIEMNQKEGMDNKISLTEFKGFLTDKKLMTFPEEQDRKVGRKKIKTR